MFYRLPLTPVFYALLKNQYQRADLKILDHGSLDLQPLVKIEICLRAGDKMPQYQNRMRGLIQFCKGPGGGAHTPSTT